MLASDDNEIAEIVATRELIAALMHDNRPAADRAQEKLRDLGMEQAEIDRIKSYAAARRPDS